MPVQQSQLTPLQNLAAETASQVRRHKYASAPNNGPSGIDGLC